MCYVLHAKMFRPVVLNCGHVYSESCIVDPHEQKLRCQVCPSFHPTGCPKVCLDLHNFLVEQFPKELAHRRDDEQLKHVNPTALIVIIPVPSFWVDLISKIQQKTSLSLLAATCFVVGEGYRVSR